MRISVLILGSFLGLATLHSQTETKRFSQKFESKGQVSAWAHYNPNNDFKLYSGSRYIPQFNQEISFGKHLIDFEASANISGGLKFKPNRVDSYGDIDPYRLWARYSNEQLELRVGLQKIDFGTAVMLRALRWFDQVDPRDPLRLTNGVWGGLARYYFLDNTNIWLWGLKGNDNPKGMEFFETYKNTPEVGGRIQTGIPSGEAGLSFHHRTAAAFNPISSVSFGYEKVPENRIGLDAKWDLLVGLWFEAAWVQKTQSIDYLTNQEMVTIGTDYTFDVGSGLNVTLEHMLFAVDEKAFNFDNSVHFSAFMANYSIGMFDSLSGMVYYDWTTNSTYNFMSWFRQFDYTSLYLIGYSNPKVSTMSFGGNAMNMFGGKGLQVMFVFNY